MKLQNIWSLNRRYLLLLWIVLIFQHTSAQSDSSAAARDTADYVITKLNGKEVIGRILKDDGREVLIETKTIGRLYLKKEEIQSIVKVVDKKEVVHGTYQPTGPFTTRYAFTNNALPVKKGENYAMINLYGPEVHFAVSQNFNVGIITSWIASPLVLALKYSFKRKETMVNFSVGTLLGTTGYLNKFRGYGGLHWANVTFGTRKNNLTFSGGYAYLQTGTLYTTPPPGVYLNELPVSQPKKNPTPHGPVLSLAGITKVGAKASLFFDSMFGFFSNEVTGIVQEEHTPGYSTADPYTYVDPTYKYIVSTRIVKTTTMFLMPGLRFQRSEHRAFQVALAQVLIKQENEIVSFPLPMISWFRQF
jgi:hypothetical protein